MCWLSAALPPLPQMRKLPPPGPGGQDVGSQGRQGLQVFIAQGRHGLPVPFQGFPVQVGRLPVHLLVHVLSIHG